MHRFLAEAAITFREQYLGALLFGKPERVPLMPGLTRESTFRAWREQGLPEGVDYFQALLAELGLPAMSQEIRTIDAPFKMIPTFEESVGA